MIRASKGSFKQSGYISKLCHLSQGYVNSNIKSEENFWMKCRQNNMIVTHSNTYIISLHDYYLCWSSLTILLKSRNKFLPKLSKDKFGSSSQVRYFSSKFK